MDNSNYYLQEFKKFISLQTSSINTIKNYLSDLRVFFNFASANLLVPVTPQTLPQLLSEPVLLKYDEYLAQNNPPTTAKRRASSLKKFIEFCSTLTITPIPPLPPTPPQPPAAAFPPTPLDVGTPKLSPTEDTPPPLQSSADTPVIHTTPWSIPQPPATPEPEVTSEIPPTSLVNFLPDFDYQPSPAPPAEISPQIKSDPQLSESKPTPEKPKTKMSVVFTILLLVFLISFALTYFLITFFVQV